MMTPEQKIKVLESVLAHKRATDLQSNFSPTSFPWTLRRTLKILFPNGIDFQERGKCDCFCGDSDLK